MRFLFAVCLLFLNGCADELNPPAVVVSEVKELAVEDLTYSFEAMPEPNQYKLIFKWPVKTEPFYLRSLHSKGFQTSPLDTVYSEILEGGKHYTYQMLKENGDVLTELKVLPPHDIVLSGNIDYAGDVLLRANRIFIRKDAMLTLLRSNIIIRAKEIIAEGGTIRNYPTDFMECIRVGQAYNGGDISIFSEKAAGKLTIVNQGALGCHPGAKGGNGGAVKVNIDDGERLNLDIQLLRATGLPWKNGFRPLHEYGEVGTACVSLKKEDNRECL